MQTAHETVAAYIKAQAIDMPCFNEWFQDGKYMQDEANIHDARYLCLLERFVEERDTEANGIASTSTQATRLPRILNKHVHGIPKGAYYIGRGSPLGNPFVIGRDGTRDEVCDKYDAWLDKQPQLLPLIASLEGRDLVCFCAPKRCHGLTVRRRANPGLACEAT